MGNCLACFKTAPRKNDGDIAGDAVNVADTVVVQQKNADSQLEARDRKERGMRVCAVHYLIEIYC